MLSDAQKILNRLAWADRVHQKEAGGSLLLRSVKFVLAFILACFILDVALHLNAGWRLSLLAGLAAGVALLFAAGAYVAYVRRNRLERVARFLESRDEAMGSKLINLLQLQTQTTDQNLVPTTRRLAQLAVDDYAVNLMDMDFRRLARTDEVRRQLRRAAWGLLLFVAFLAGFFKVTAVEVLRFADPFGDHPPYSFTQLEILEPGSTGTNVIYGKNFVVKVQASGHHPKEAYLTAHPPEHPEQAITLPMFDKGSGGFQQQLENIRSELVVYAHTKDGLSRSRKTRIGLILTPQLEQSFVKVTPPAYTGLAPEEKPYRFDGVQALAGSEIQFRLRSNRPLHDGILELTGGQQPPQRITMSPTNENEVVGSFTAERSGRLRFELTDVDRIASQDHWEGALTVTHDLPPEVRIVEPEKDCFVAMDFKLEATIEASDDYGLHHVRLHRALNGVYSVPKVIDYDTVTRNARETLKFDFATLGVQPGDVISLFAEAIDTAPQPHLVRSQTVQLMVISIEDYNNFLREQTDLTDIEAKYALLKDDLQDLIEQQKKLGEQADGLKKELTDPDAQDRDELTRKLDQLLARQNELNQKLNQHAERMDNFVRENPLYDVEKELRDLLQQQAQTIRQSTQTNNATAGQIAQRSSLPNGARQMTPGMLDEFAQASQEQVERLGGAQQKTQQQVLDTLAEMSQMQELMKDFNQFEALYRVQQELAEQTRAYNRAGQLNREEQLALKSFAGTEQQVAGLLKQLEDKLRKDADAAEKKFPKAAKSGRNLAGQMQELRLNIQANNATRSMLAAQGEQSHQRSERLRSDMESLFSECQGSGNCPSCNELDSYLTLQRGMKPGNNFAQMARSRKFGGAGMKPGMQRGMGEGEAGTSGYAVTDGSTLDVLGNEKAAVRGREEINQSNKLGKGEPGLPGGSAVADADKPDVMKNLNPVNRQSGAVSSESLIEEYNDIVERYFETLTARPKP